MTHTTHTPSTPPPYPPHPPHTPHTPHTPPPHPLHTLHTLHTHHTHHTHTHHTFSPRQVPPTSQCYPVTSRSSLALRCKLTAKQKVPLLSTSCGHRGTRTAMALPVVLNHFHHGPFSVNTSSTIAAISMRDYLAFSLHSTSTLPLHTPPPHSPSTLPLHTQPPHSPPHDFDCLYCQRNFQITCQ